MLFWLLNLHFFCVFSTLLFPLSSAMMPLAVQQELPPTTLPASLEPMDTTMPPIPWCASTTLLPMVTLMPFTLSPSFSFLIMMASPGSVVLTLTSGTISAAKVKSNDACQVDDTIPLPQGLNNSGDLQQLEQPEASQRRQHANELCPGRLLEECLAQCLEKRQ